MADGNDQLGADLHGTSSKQEVGRGFRRRVFEFLEPELGGGRVERAFDFFMLALIAANVLAVVLESVKSLADEHGALFETFEVFSIAVFSVEYLGRLWACVEDPRYAHPILGRLRFMSTPAALIDLAAVLPAFLPLGALDLRFARALRLLRLLRALKVTRYSASLRAITEVIRERRTELTVAVTFTLILLVFASCVLYFIEKPAQPNAFSSIPAAMWWAVACLTTVGYGDIYPITPLGKFIASVIAMVGVGLFALPAGILAAGCTEKFQRKRTCPHCAREL